MRCSRHVVAALVGLSLIILADGASAGVVAISRSSTIAASAATSLDTFDESDQFDTLGAYDQTVSGSAAAEGGGSSQASASQQSDVVTGLTLSGFANGTASAQVAEFDALAAAATSTFLLVFDVISQPEPMTLNGFVGSTFDAAARVTLADHVSAQILFEELVDFGEGDDVPINQSLTLPPGRYRLQAGGTVTGTPVPNEANFGLSFSVGDAATVIPLAPAVWPGAAMLLVMWRMIAVKSGRRTGLPSILANRN